MNEAHVEQLLQDRVCHQLDIPELGHSRHLHQPTEHDTINSAGMKLCSSSERAHWPSEHMQGMMGGQQIYNNMNLSASKPYFLVTLLVFHPWAFW